MAELFTHYMFLDPTLRIYLRYEGDFLDSSPSAYHLTPSGTPGDVEGKYGKAKSFALATSYASITNTNGPNLNITGNAITCMAWVYPTNVAASWQYALSKRDAANDGYYLALEGGTLARFFIGNGSTSASATGTTVMRDNHGYLLVGTYDGSNVRVYVNGKLEGTTGLSGNIGSSSGVPFYVALNSLNTAEGFWGRLDETAVWAKAWSAADIASLYNNLSYKLENELRPAIFKPGKQLFRNGLIKDF